MARAQAPTLKKPRPGALPARNRDKDVPIGVDMSKSSRGQKVPRAVALHALESTADDARPFLRHPRTGQLLRAQRFLDPLARMVAELAVTVEALGVRVRDPTWIDAGRELAAIARTIGRTGPEPDLYPDRAWRRR